MPRNCPLNKKDSHACWECIYEFGNACIYHEMQEEKAEQAKLKEEENRLKQPSQWVFDESDGYMVCSTCHGKALINPEHISEYVFSNYCPHCGANMKGGTE